MPAMRRARFAALRRNASTSAGGNEVSGSLTPAAIHVSMAARALSGSVPIDMPSEERTSPPAIEKFSIL